MNQKKPLEIMIVMLAVQTSMDKKHLESPISDRGAQSNTPGAAADQ